MKLVASLLAASLIMIMGCQKTDLNSVNERLKAMEARLAKLEQRPSFPTPQEPPEQKAAYNIPVGDSHYVGDKDAKVSLFVFSDFQCPFCGRVDPLLQEAVKDPELKGKIKVVFKHFPLSFHDKAKPAAKAALAAGEQGNDFFWKMSQKLFSDQRNLTPENFNKWAKEIGLDVAKFEASLKNNDPKYEEIIKADMEVGIKEAKVRGTPSIYVGGWELRERSVDGIKKIIKEKAML